MLIRTLFSIHSQKLVNYESTFDLYRKSFFDYTVEKTVFLNLEIETIK